MRTDRPCLATALAFRPMGASHGRDMGVPGQRGR
jgi:hypothetical protein